MENVVKILKEVGAVLTDDHFVLTSGNHSDVYINKDALLPWTEKMSQVGRLLAQRFVEEEVEVVVGPATAGIVIAQWVAYHLSDLKNWEIPGVYTDKTLENGEKRHEFKRGYDRLVSDNRVLVVEDVTATGSSIDLVLESVGALTDTVVGIGVIVNRDPELINETRWGVPFEALSVFEAEAIPPEDCPLCKEGVKINTNVGHGKAFLRERGEL